MVPGALATAGAVPTRYKLIAVTFSLSMLLYIDRVAISTARNPISEAFGLSDTQFGWVLSAFALGYALFQTPAGAARRSLRCAHACWQPSWRVVGLHRADRPGLEFCVAAAVPVSVRCGRSRRLSHVRPGVLRLAARRPSAGSRRASIFPARGSGPRSRCRRWRGS